jgi:hypothetical protein
MLAAVAVAQALPATRAKTNSIATAMRANRDIGTPSIAA